jgi:hypothetical protein
MKIIAPIIERINNDAPIAIKTIIVVDNVSLLEDYQSSCENC